MTKEEYDTFFDLLQKLVGSDTEGSWISRRQKLIDEAGEDDMANLQELTAWFAD